jgi:23S rRNA (cytidine1920-2'-O)/16S rRNA (cytidine1409-2'-O)-methyltransferase
MKKRVDVLLAESGICRSRSEAKDLVERGLVNVNGVVVDKVSREFEEGDFKNWVESKKVKILVKQYVGRGAYKLLHALEVFRVDCKDLVCLDIGSSTGGFTQVLLQHGAQKVYAVDVGTNQFDKNLLETFKEKINLYEGQDIRSFEISEKADLVVCDLSFISAKEIIKILHKFLKKDGQAIVLIKPQFEVGKENNPKGIVRDEKSRREVLEDVKKFAAECKFVVVEETESPIEGGDGNIEYLLCMNFKSGCL